MRQDPLSHVAVESFVSGDVLTLAGEVSSKATVDVTDIARKVIEEIGYTDSEIGFTADSCLIFTNIHQQSQDIHQGVVIRSGEDYLVGSGDQGIMYGYATKETDNYMPLTVNLAQGLVRKLDFARHNTSLGKYLRPDGKSQVTMRFDNQGRPAGLSSVILSAQHNEDIDEASLRQLLRQVIIDPICKLWMKDDTKIHINATGRFVIGGPIGDTGLTGRKIMVDTYGTLARHGGGAFSGKDGTKVDRSAAYMARYVAKNVVAAGFCDRCEVAISYAIGSIYPEAVQIQTFGSERIDIARIYEAVEKVFSFSVNEIINVLNLRQPQFRKTAVYGHFGRENEGFAWESLDKVQALQSVVK